MMMIAHFLMLLLPLMFARAQDDVDLIEWNDTRKLTWADFKGRPDTNSPNAALTNSSINMEFGYDDTRLTYSIKCRFNKNKSWGRVKNDYILAHEQGHFDIAEIHARRLKQALSQYKFNASTVAKDVNEIYAGIISEHNQFQQAYDLETDHSRNPVKQKAWVEKIADTLQSLSAFSNYK